MSDQPAFGDFPYKIQVTPSEYSPTGFGPDMTSTEFKRKPIQLRGRPGSQNSLTKSTLSTKSFVTEIQKAGRYNHSKAVAEMRQVKESPERSIPQPTREWQASPNRSPSPTITSRSPMRRVRKAASNYERISRTSHQMTPDLEYSDNSYLSTPIRTSSPISSKVKPSPRLITREALNLPNDRSLEKLVSYEADLPRKGQSPQRGGNSKAPIKKGINLQRESVETRSESASGSDIRKSPSLGQLARQETYSTAERSPARLQTTNFAKPLQASKPSSRRQLTYSQESQYLMQNPLKAQMERMNSSSGSLYRPLLVENSYETLQ